MSSADDDVLAGIDTSAPAGAAGAAGAMEDDAPVAAAGGAGGKTRKGRGGKAMDEDESEDRYAGRSGVFESLDAESSGPGPQKSVEGWIVIVTGVHEEAAEDDVLDKFSEFGAVKNINMNLDRRTGYVKGYALLEYYSRKEAEAAIKGMTGQKLLGRPLKVDWAFTK